MKNTSYPNTQHGSLFARPRSSILRPLRTALTYFTSLFQVLFQCIFNYCVTSSKFKLSHHSATQRLTNISLFLVSFHRTLKDQEESSDRNSPKRSVFWEGRETTRTGSFHFNFNSSCTKHSPDCIVSQKLHSRGAENGDSLPSGWRSDVEYTPSVSQTLWRLDTDDSQRQRVDKYRHEGFV